MRKLLAGTLAAVSVAAALHTGGADRPLITLAASARAELGKELHPAGTVTVTTTTVAGGGPVAAGPPGTHYRFTVTDAVGRPGRWNPCAPIPVIVNLTHAPAGALTDLVEALRRLDAASGLRFTITATTTSAPSAGWGEQREPGYPGWAPVLIGWAAPGDAILSTSGEESGMTKPVWVDSGGHEVFVSGEVVFNDAQNSWYQPGFGVGRHRGALFEHELGHVAGLNHVADPSQVMNPVLGGAADYGAGDRAGLRALGGGGCLTAPAP